MPMPLYSRYDSPAQPIHTDIRTHRSIARTARKYPPSTGRPSMPAAISRARIAANAAGESVAEVLSMLDQSRAAALAIYFVWRCGERRGEMSM